MQGTSMFSKLCPEGIFKGKIRLKTPPFVVNLLHTVQQMCDVT